MRDKDDLPASSLHDNGEYRAMTIGSSEDADAKQQSIISQIIRSYPQEDKYSGSADSMSLQYRLDDFRQYCNNMGLDQRHIMRVFPSMLTGDAREWKEPPADVQVILCVKRW